jgi:hypothetical protein
MASIRALGNEMVKLLIMGNKANAGHTHEDKGSFVLEFAGQTFACDPGTCDYSHPLSDILKHCERHNMLVPVGTATRPQPKNPLPFDIKPQGHGDARQFHAVIDATPGWEDYYKRWIRTWDSPGPDTLVIRDEYELAQGNGVEFYWNTAREVHVDGPTITLYGRRGSAIISVPPDCQVRVDELPMLEDESIRRIAICKSAPAGSLEVTVKLFYGSA